MDKMYLFKDITKVCESCGKLTILCVTGEVYQTKNFLMRRREWWCGCGYTETAESLIIEPETPSEQFKEDIWKMVNGE